MPELQTRVLLPRDHPVTADLSAQTTSCDEWWSGVEYVAMTQSQSESQSRQDGAFHLTSSPSATGFGGRYCMESNSKPWRLPVGTDLQIATRQDDKTANPRWKTAALSSLHNRRPSLVNDESSIQTVQNTSKNMQKEERRGYSCEKRLRLSVQDNHHSISRRRAHGAAPRAMAKSVDRGRDGTSSTPRAGKSVDQRSRAVVGDFNRRQGPSAASPWGRCRVKSCQITQPSSPGAVRFFLPRDMEKLASSRPRGVLVLWQCCSWPWTVSPLSASSQDMSN